MIREQGQMEENAIEAKINKVDQEEAGPSSNQFDNGSTYNDEEKSIVAVTTVAKKPISTFPSYLVMAAKKYLSPVHLFFKRILDPTARVTADIYAYMFMCDFLNFFIVIFGFSAFGTHQGDGGVQAYLEENKVPIPFLIMLILQFALIIVDRALYLRKFILGKILFQIILIIGVHIWMFFVLPAITERTFNAKPPPPLWYMVKCIYLLLSAYQIRCGYPRRIIGNYFCKGYSFVNMVCFKVFMLIPFVFELRTLMDWIWTDTSMTLMDWLKMEDIFANIYQLKCSRNVEDEFPQPRGTKKAAISKYLMGGGVLALIIALIWFPLVLFAFGNSVGESNPPFDVTVDIRIGPYLSAYKMTAQTNNIQVYSETDYEYMSNVYKKDRTAQTFLSNYLHDDVAVVNLGRDSSSVWTITPPDLLRLEEDVKSNTTISVVFSMIISHQTRTDDNPSLIDEKFSVDLKAGDSQREKLYTMLMDLRVALESNDPDPTINNQTIVIKELFPKFMKVFNKGTVRPVSQLMDSNPSSPLNSKIYRDTMLTLHLAKRMAWWQVTEKCDDDNYKNFLSRIPKAGDCENLVLFTFNDKLFPATLNFISGSGIIGLYTTFVFLASRQLRSFFSGICSKIMFEDLPNVDRVLQLCLDIYLVREANELALEEDLFAKLVFLYRSPETMIKWTRPPDEPDAQQAQIAAEPDNR